MAIARNRGAGELAGIEARLVPATCALQGPRTCFGITVLRAVPEFNPSPCSRPVLCSPTRAAIGKFQSAPEFVGQETIKDDQRRLLGAVRRIAGKQAEIGIPRVLTSTDVDISQPQQAIDDDISVINRVAMSSAHCPR